ncbi:MAG: GNAT family N-acetyltransferase [Planctomycetota bacterium]
MSGDRSPETEEVVSLREITKETLGAVLRLEVAPEQRQFVAENAVSIAEAHFTKEAWFRAIYAGKIPVGFVMLYLDEKQPRYFVWRLMIDRRHQRKGYGGKGLAMAIDHVRSLSRADVLWVSYVPGEGNPSPLYEKLGFSETGEIIDGERVMKLRLSG